MRYPAGELDDLLAAADLAQRIGDDLAVLTGDDLGQFALALVEQLPELEQNRGALGQRRVTPGGERGCRGVDHRSGILDAAEGELTSDLARRRVRHR